MMCAIQDFINYYHHHPIYIEKQAREVLVIL